MSVQLSLFWYLFSPVEEFRKLHISASDGNWPSAHPQVAICFSAWHEFKQVFETNKIMTIWIGKVKVMAIKQLDYELSISI